jgi:hypothetical protein
MNVVALADPHRVDRKLVAFSDRLLNSVQLYFGLARRLARLRLSFEQAPPWETETAMVESFALHTRGLADFFFTTAGSANPRRAQGAGRLGPPLLLTDRALGWHCG